MTVAEVRFRYDGGDGTGLAGFKWTSGATPRYVLQLAHGAGEHSGRYRERLAPLIDAGAVIYSADHRGHGLTSGMNHLGDFGPGGAEACISDMARLTEIAREQYPDLPVILLGHSMGAMFAQVYLLEHADLIDAFVLSGTTGPGPRFAGSWNSAFDNPRTDYDWLSRDTAEVDAYVADPFCGIQFTPTSLTSVLAVGEIARTAPGIERLRALDLPIYVFVGEKDPINNNMLGLTPLIERYEALGFSVTLKVYPDGRHEMFNEINRDEVLEDLRAWIEQHARSRHHRAADSRHTAQMDNDQEDSWMGTR